MADTVLRLLGAGSTGAVLVLLLLARKSFVQIALALLLPPSSYFCQAPKIRRHCSADVLGEQRSQCNISNAIFAAHPLLCNLRQAALQLRRQTWTSLLKKPSWLHPCIGKQCLHTVSKTVRFKAICTKTNTGTERYHRRQRPKQRHKPTTGTDPDTNTDTDTETSRHADAQTCEHAGSEYASS